jgi:FAD synthase
MSKISIDVGDQKVITPEFGATIYKALEGWLFKLGDVRENVEVITVKANIQQRSVNFKVVFIDPMSVNDGMIIREELRKKYEPHFFLHKDQLVNETSAIQLIQKNLTEQTIAVLRDLINELQRNCTEIRDAMGPIRDAGRP